ncbi:uncharacterized protein LOC129731876 [Wyeomyia smithii]|uniref:uncharacterized protein LOC129731876 n=1 Tax=Wyeomyia smithii TaxID=174621 RepID=UPI002467B807|nr:uncharacterized protein LOC129731876 [Wyeomyia smithii]
MQLPCQDNPHKQNDLTLSVWKVCNQIRHLLDSQQRSELRQFLQKHDPYLSGIIQGYEFVNVLKCILKQCLSGNEICQLAEYFQTSDSAGVAYRQFLDLITDDGLHTSKTQRTLSASEHRRLALVLMGIAQALRFREQVLRPYFEDYDLIAQNGGSVTAAYFKRVLYFLGITLGQYEWELMFKRFTTDSYKIDYESFVEEIDQLFRYLDSRGPIERQCDENVPPKVITVEQPKIDRPEVGVMNLSQILCKEIAHHPCLQPSREKRNFQTLINHIKKHIWENRVRTREFFEQFDAFGCGWISRSQFVRSMDAIGLSGLHRLPLTDCEVSTICDHYQDIGDANRIRWERFTDEIDEVFTVQNLDKGPLLEFEVPPEEIRELPREGELKKEQHNQVVRDLAEDVVLCVRTLVRGRRIFIRPVFEDFDPHHNGHVSRSQVGEALSILGIVITEEQIYALCQRYSDDLGFNYVKFFRDVDPMPTINSAYQDLQTRLKLVNASSQEGNPHPHECDIVRVLAKVKGQAVRQKLRIADFMRGFDPLNHFRITVDQFERGLSIASIILTPTEVATLAKTFKTPLGETIDYKRFCDTVAEVDYQCQLEKSPLLVPLQHFPSEDGPHNHLSFEERVIFSQTLQKLAHSADVVSNLRPLFQDFDRQRLGVVNRNQLIRSFAARDLHTAISSREFEVLCKGFAVQIGYRQEVNYRALLASLDYLYANRENHPF